VLDPGANALIDGAAVEEAWPTLPTASVLSLLEIPLAAVTAVVRLAADTGVRPAPRRWDVAAPGKDPSSLHDLFSRHGVTAL
jgi:hypothetical protein